MTDNGDEHDAQDPPPDPPPIPAGETLRAWPTPAPLPNPLRELGRYLYNSNPFYALSAVLILVGLHLLCKDELVLADPHSIAAAGWLHLSLLAGYTVLLAGAGVVVVRVARVWEDARTIILSVLLLLVAMSVEFDHLLLTRPATAKAVLGVGAVFALLLVESTIRGARVRLPLGYRIPLFAGLALFFLYPVILLTVLDQVGYADNNLGREGTRWLVFLFPAASAVVALTLLPGAAKGPAYVSDNGTPWRWPWYPRPAFVFLAVGVCFRAYYLTLTFDPQAKLDSAFGLYYLTPFLVATAAVAFEGARAAGSRGGKGVALVAPLTVLLTALPGTQGSPPFRSMLMAHLELLGPPIRIACWGLLMLYGYAILRGARAAWAGVAAMLALAAFISPRTTDWGAFSSKPQTLPLALLTAGGVALVLYNPRRSDRWALLSFAVIGLGLSLVPGDSLEALHFGAAALALCAVAMLLGVVFRDVFAEVVGKWGALGLVAASFYLTFSESARCRPWQANGGALGFAIFVTSILFAVARLLKSDFHKGLGLFSLIPVGARAIAHALGLLRLVRNPTAVALVIGGVASFLIGAVITAVKAGWRPFLTRTSHPLPSENDAQF